MSLLVRQDLHDTIKAKGRILHVRLTCMWEAMIIKPHKLKSNLVNKRHTDYKVRESLWLKDQWLSKLLKTIRQVEN